MAILLVRDPAGNETAIDESEYRANPGIYELAPGQDIAVDITAGAPVAGEVQALDARDYLATQGRLGEALAPEEQAALTKASLEEERFGGIGDKATQAARGLASGASFGLSELALRAGDTSLEREDEEAARRVNEGYFTGGSIAGELGTALVSGGGGLAGRLASMTPSGLLARQTARIIAHGGEAAFERIGRAALAGGIESAVSSAGDYMASQALAENPQFSIETMLGKMGRGALLGAAVGGGLTAGGAATEALASRLADDTKGFAAKLDELASRRGEKFAGELADAGGAAGKGRAKYAELLPPAQRTERQVSEYLGGVLTAVDDAAGRRAAAARELKGMESMKAFDALPREQAIPLRAELSAAVEQHAAAVNTARGWARKMSRSVSPEDLRAGKVPVLDDQVDDAVEALAHLDETTAALDDVMTRSRAATGYQTPVPAAAPEPPSRWQDWKEKLTTAGGALETAQSLGAPVPDLDAVPVIGPALSAYVKLKAGYNVLKRGGGSMPRTPRVQAATQVVAARDRLATTVRKLVTGGARAARSATAVSAGSRAAVSAVSLIDDARSSSREAAQASPERIRAAVIAHTATLPPALRAGAEQEALRRAQYLADKAPRPPFQGSPWAPTEWKPSLTQALEWTERWWAANNPEQAIEDLATGAAKPWAAETMRELYPQLWLAQAQELRAQTEEIAKTVPRAQRLRIGAAFDVPLDGTQMPGYAIATSSPTTSLADGGMAAGAMGRPSVSSPVAELAMTGAEQRAMR